MPDVIRHTFQETLAKAKTRVEQVAFFATYEKGCPVLMKTAAFTLAKCNENQTKENKMNAKIK